MQDDSGLLITSLSCVIFSYAPLSLRARSRVNHLADQNVLQSTTSFFGIDEELGAAAVYDGLKIPCGSGSLLDAN